MYLLSHLLFSTLSFPFFSGRLCQSWMRSRVLNNTRLLCSPVLVPAAPDCLQFLQHNSRFPISGPCIFCSFCQEYPCHLLSPMYTCSSFKTHFRWHLFRAPPLISSLWRQAHPLLCLESTLYSPLLYHDYSLNCLLPSPHFSLSRARNSQFHLFSFL